MDGGGKDFNWKEEENAQKEKGQRKDEGKVVSGGLSKSGTSRREDDDKTGERRDGWTGRGTGGQVEGRVDR